LRNHQEKCLRHEEEIGKFRVKDSVGVAECGPVNINRSGSQAPVDSMDKKDDRAAKEEDLRRKPIILPAV